MATLHSAHAQTAEGFINETELDSEAFLDHCQWVYEIAKDHLTEEEIVAAFQSCVHFGYQLAQKLADEGKFQKEPATWKKKEVQ